MLNTCMQQPQQMYVRITCFAVARHTPCQDEMMLFVSTCACNKPCIHNTYTYTYACIHNTYTHVHTMLHSGKTYTMSGREDVIGLDSYHGDTHDGIVTRAVNYLYQQVRGNVHVYHVHIYIYRYRYVYTICRERNNSIGMRTVN